MNTIAQQTPLSVSTHVSTPLRRWFVLLAIALLAVNCAAKTCTWNGGGTDNNWSTAANWGVSGTPVTGDSLVFNADAARKTSVNNIALGTLSSIAAVTISGGGYSISGNALTLTGNFSNTGDNTWAINLTISTARTIESLGGGTGGTLTLSGTIGLGSLGSVILNANHNTGTDGNILVSGLISGTGTGVVVTKGGASSGKVTLSNSGNTYAGKTAITSGFLAISADGNLGAVPSSAVTDKIQLAGGYLQTTATFTLNSKRGSNITVAGGTTGFWADPGTTLSYGGIIGQAGSLSYDLSLDGDGTIVLSGNSTYGGKTKVIANIVRISHAAAFGKSLLAGGERVEINALSIVELSGGITVPKSLIIDYGQLVSVSGNNTWAGSIIIGKNTSGNCVIRSSESGSTLTLGVVSIDTDNVTDPVNTFQNLYLEGAGNILISDAISGDGTDGVGGYILGHGDVIMDGTGTLTLSGVNTYSGRSIVNSGTLVIDSDARLGAVPASTTAGRLVIKAGSTVEAAGDVTLAANRGIAIGPPTGDGAGTIQVDSGFTLTYGGIIANGGTGNGALTKTGDGKLDLTGACTYTGPTAINVGVLAVNGSLVAASAVTVAAGATLQGIGTAAGTATLSGTVAPGNSVATLNTGDHSWEGGGFYDFEINDAAGAIGSSPGWDLLNIAGTLTVNATPESKFTIRLISLADTAPGIAANWDARVNRRWRIATGTAAASGFSAAKFALDTSAFTSYNDLVGGVFTVEQSADTYGVDLVFTRNPIRANPATYARAWGTFIRISIADLLANFTEGDSLNRQLVSVATGDLGTVTALSGSMTDGYILLSPTHNLTEIFNYTVEDTGALGHTATSTLTMTVNNAVGSANSISSSGGGAITIKFAGIPGYKYRVQRATPNVDSTYSDLTDGGGISGAQTTVGASGIWTFTDPSPPTPSAYYRLRQDN